MLTFGEFLTTVLSLLGHRRLGRRAEFGSTCVALILWLFVAKNSYTTVRALKAWHDQRVSNAARWGDAPGHLIYYDDTWHDFGGAIDWMRAHANRGDVVACSTPQWIYLNAGLKSVMPPMEADVALVQELLDAVPVRYLVTERLGHAGLVRRFLDGAVDAYPDRWELVYTAPKRTARVYRRAGPQPTRREVRSRTEDGREPAPGKDHRSVANVAEPSVGAK
jgi:hypothetical protein